jgi:hypothetical protein
MRFKELKFYWILVAVFSIIPWIFRYPFWEIGVNGTLAVGVADLFATGYILKKLNFKLSVTLLLVVLFVISQIYFFQYLLMFFAWSINGFAP